jgi:hypothetical protein
MAQWKRKSTAPRTCAILVKQELPYEPGVYRFHVVWWKDGDWLVSNGQDSEPLLGRQDWTWKHIET